MSIWLRLCVLIGMLWVAHGAAATSLVQHVATLKPAIVAVGSYLPTRRPPQSILGTGFVIGNGQYILTNAHVIPDINQSEREQLSVISGTGKKAKIHKVTLVATDTLYDIAVLKLKKGRLPAVILGDDARVKEGEDIFFMGFPIGQILGVFSVTHRGIISAITPNVIPQASARALTPALIKKLRDPFGAFQLDATAYPGNSGSPVFNAQGAVIGMVNKVFIKESKETILSKPSGITYAIPIHFAQQLLQQHKIAY